MAGTSGTSGLRCRSGQNKTYREAAALALAGSIAGQPARVEPVIGHMKAEYRMGRNYLKGRDGDRINAVLAAAGYKFSLLLRWLDRLLRSLLQMPFATPAPA
jgi:hypothetical protein